MPRHGGEPSSGGSQVQHCPALGSQSLQSTRAWAGGQAGWGDHQGSVPSPERFPDGDAHLEHKLSFDKRVLLSSSAVSLNSSHLWPFLTQAHLKYQQ